MFALERGDPVVGLTYFKLPKESKILFSFV